MGRKIEKTGERRPLELRVPRALRQREGGKRGRMGWVMRGGKGS